MKHIIFSLLLVTAFAATGNAQSALRQQQFNLEKKTTAIQGYDPVAYFTTGKATKGNTRLGVVYEGVTYYFASEENKAKFKANPAAYEPQYGGWCAYAMGATGEKVEIDPETFKIVNGKLYLFYHTWTLNTLTKWNKDEAQLKNKADANWIKTYHL